MDEDTKRGCTFVLYSLSRRECVRDARVGDRAVEFEVNREFIVVVRPFSLVLQYLF